MMGRRTRLAGGDERDAFSTIARKILRFGRGERAVVKTRHNRRVRRVARIEVREEDVE